MESEKCRVCHSDIENLMFSAHILGRCVSYYECPFCSYVQTESPNWLDEAYDSVINDCDTGMIMRNQVNVHKVVGTLISLGKLHGRVIDAAGGYGILTRLLRDRGVETLWSDPYCQNLAAIGFEHDGEKADLVTAFEAFEHFVTPTDEMKRLFDIAPNLLISTELIPTPTPSPEKWWYYGFNHGQHVGFYRVQTLQYLAKHFGKHLITDGQSYHLYTDKPVSKYKWFFHVLLSNYFPTFTTRGLKSKIGSDFEKMSAKT